MAVISAGPTAPRQQLEAPLCGQGFKRANIGTMWPRFSRVANLLGGLGIWRLEMSQHPSLKLRASCIVVSTQEGSWCYFSSASAG